MDKANVLRKAIHWGLVHGCLTSLPETLCILVSFQRNVTCHKWQCDQFHSGWVLPEAFLIKQNGFLRTHVCKVDCNAGHHCILLMSMCNWCCTRCWRETFTAYLICCAWPRSMAPRSPQSSSNCFWWPTSSAIVRTPTSGSTVLGAWWDVPN